MEAYTRQSHLNKWLKDPEEERDMSYILSAIIIPLMDNK